MGIISGLLGNASEMDLGAAQKEHKDFLIPEETIEAAFLLIRDQILFTDKRLILIDKQGLRGKKVNYLSIPYKSIKYYSIETAGRFDLDAELKVWVSDSTIPTLQKELKKGIDILGLQRTLSYYVLTS